MPKRRLRSPRRASASGLPRAERLRALRQQLSAIGRAHRANGGTQAEWADAWRGLADLARLPPLDATRYARTLLLADLIERWYTDAAWLDEAGQPRALLARGEDGFEGLCRALGHGPESPRLRREALEAGILKHAGRHRLLPTDRTAIIRRTGLYLDAVAMVLTEWHATLRHNQSPATTPATSRLERTISYQPIAERFAAEYYRFVRDAGSKTIHVIDNWLLAHQPEPEEAVIWVGFHLFGFTHSTPTIAPWRRTRRG